MSYTVNRLRQLREEREIKQTVAAEDIGISRAMLSNYESGQMPSLWNAIKLADYYHVSLDYIFAGKSAPTASDVSALVNAAIMYQCSGSPCGEQPLAAWRDFMRHLTKCLQAAVTGDSAALIDNANAATVAALEVTKMPAAFYKKKGGTDQ